MRPSICTFFPHIRCGANHDCASTLVTLGPRKRRHRVAYNSTNRCLRPLHAAYHPSFGISPSLSLVYRLLPFHIALPVVQLYNCLRPHPSHAKSPTTGLGGGSSLNTRLYLRACAAWKYTTSRLCYPDLSLFPKIANTTNRGSLRLLPQSPSQCRAPWCCASRKTSFRARSRKP